MNNPKEIRWKQRFTNYEKSFLLLERTLKIPKPSEAEKGGLIQFYETTFELGWKVMKDYLESQGHTVSSPRDVIKTAFQAEVISDGEKWMQALEDRNLTTHVYDEEVANRIIDQIRNIYFILLQHLYIFFKDESQQ